MQVGLKDEAEDCFRKYIDRYCYKPSLVLKDIQKYNSRFKDLKTKSLYKYLSEITEKAILGCTYHIHCHKKELFNLRFQNATNQLDNTSRIKEVRRNIARIQTAITAASKAE